MNAKIVIDPHVQFYIPVRQNMLMMELHDALFGKYLSMNEARETVIRARDPYSVFHTQFVNDKNW